MNILPVYQTSSPPDVLPLEVVDRGSWHFK